MAGPPSGLLRGVGRAASAASDQATTFGFLSGWRLVRLLPERQALAVFRAIADRIHKSGQAMVWAGMKEPAELYWELLRDEGLTMAPLEPG